MIPFLAPIPYWGEMSLSYRMAKHFFSLFRAERMKSCIVSSSGCKVSSFCAFRERTKGINHPVIEKLFNEIAPKYDERREQLGQGGGYTRIYSLGERRGDAAQMAIIELI